MKRLALAAVLVLATSTLALEQKAVKVRDDFGTEPAYNHILQYYYIACPTYSWFWAFYCWGPGDIIGTHFLVGDQPTGGYAPADPFNTTHLDMFPVLDLAGYGQMYPGLYTVRLDVYFTDTCGCIIGPWLWNSGPIETGYGWNIISIEPDLEVCPCVIRPGFAPMFVLTATMIVTDARYPAWGFDYISTPIENGCQMHDIGCLAALYPRWHVNIGYYGSGSPSSSPTEPF